jgi:peptidoglycan/LPS O-acetylase OafA/YrhL
MKRKRIDFLDYMKAVCVLLVIATHYEWESKHSLIFGMGIKMAVPVFMIITGYNFAMSYSRNTDGRLKNMCRLKILAPKIERFMIPFIIICFVEMILLGIEKKHINIPRIFLEGAYGPGSYYVPVMIQLIFIFLLIYWLIKKNAKIGIMVVGAVNLLYEIGVVAFDMDEEAYRLCVVRYLLFVALGCYMYLYPKLEFKWWQLISMLGLGILYIAIVYVKNGKLVIFDYWEGTAMPIALYIFPIMVVAFKLFYNSHIDGIDGELLASVGKASYHIYLVQMVYYHFELGGKMMERVWYVAVPYNILICVTAGLLFYYAEIVARRLATGQFKTLMRGF